MSDQNNKAGDGVIDEHYCEHPSCSKWGGLGYSRSKVEKPRWWCAEHYPYWDISKTALASR